MMRRDFRGFASFVLVLLLCYSFFLSVVVNAADTRLTIQLDGDKEECFFEFVQVIDSSVYFQFLTVLGGDRGVDARIYSPGKKIIWETFAVEEDRVYFNAPLGGKYLFCLHNGGSSIKVVSFKVATLDPLKRKSRSTDKVSSSMNQIISMLSEIEELQDFLRTRERHHRNIVEAANSRVLFWSGLEAVVILVFGYFNVMLLRRMFTKKRAV